MSNEPMAKRLLDRPAEPQQPAGGDAQRMLAALERLEIALRERSNALDLMRTDLRETAKLIAKAWDALDAEGRLDNASMLLHGLEASIRRMMLFVETVPEVPDLALPASVAAAPPEPRHRSADEIAFIEAMTHDTPDATADEPPPVAEDMPVAEHVSSPSAEPDRVPTVSNVVAQLGRPDDPVEAAAPARTRDAATAVARLEALVEELAASMPPAGRSPDAVAMPEAVPEPILEQPASKPAPEPSQPKVLPEPVLVSRYREARDEPAGPESAPSEAGSAEPPAAAIAPPRYTRVIPEIELLSNLERMVSTPYPEPQLGRAVIFEPEAPPEAAPTRVPDAPRTEAGAASPPAPPPAAAESGDGDLEALLFEPQAEPEVDPAALLFEPPSTLDRPAAPQPPAPAAPAAAVAPPAPPPAEPHEPNDRGELTWEFEMPTPAALAKPPQPQPAQVQAPPPEPEPAREPETSWEIEPLAPAAPSMPPRAPDTRSAATRDDPLAPIKAMTDAERIALFE